MTVIAVKVVHFIHFKVSIYKLKKIAEKHL